MTATPNLYSHLSAPARAQLAAEVLKRKAAGRPVPLPVTLPQPHAKQELFIDSTAKRKIIVAGRRGGKTTGTTIIAVKALQAGRRVLQAAPVQDQTDAFWEGCKRALAQAIAAGSIYKNETRRLLEATNGGRIRAKTAHDADSLRGDYADLLILEEYSLMDPSAWTEVGAPMLLDNDGDAVFIFTPKRRNHAHQLYLRALSDDAGRWGVWHFTSLDNPYLSQEALAEIAADLTDEAYRQEIMAEFLENEGAVFRNITACLQAPAAPTWDEHARHHLVAGVDWGKENDYTVISLGCATCRQELALDRFNQIDYAFQRGRLQVLLDRWRNPPILPERNAAGEPIIETLIRDGARVLSGPDGRSGFNTSAATKSPLIENLALAFERAEWQFLNVPVATAELEAYERKVLALTGRSQYSAPEGMHDDTVMARALMVWAGRHSSPHAPPPQPVQVSKWQVGPRDGGRPDRSDGDSSRWRKY